ncbi:hypothetical protein BKG92_01355 [Rodentibacter ratti]|uniref:Type I restriction modification DNA specificity domain-containing protein n=1 Tax=Rodentibacter ratti TaxID=1906745 RepID=A0A1V3L219_9PAST|nr:restriction endonuclease subunit S [Rodentibacter ratti]OOF84004.1 hypothetical protein BKG92_01355 [Rodentibacter ratti]
MQRYESYKDSGVEWLGEVPEHWELTPNKYIFKLKKNLVGKKSSEYALLSLTLRGIIKRNMENPEGKFPAEFDSYQEVKKGDFVFCLFDVEETPRTVGLSSHNGMITGAYTVFETRNVNKTFIYYFYLNLDNNKKLKPLYKGLRNTISKETFFSFNTFIPPLSEQQKIALYLDDKTTKIDQAISLVEKQIELLKEHKQILIQSAVTKGLDSNVAMKDSGVEWIGEVPVHWEIKKLKFVLVLSNNKEESKNSGKRYIGMENVESFTGKINDSILSAEGVANSFCKNEILFGKLRPYLTKSYLANFDGICSTEFLVYKTTKNMNNHFALGIFLSHGFIDTVNSSTYGSKMPRANSEFLSNMLLPIPPLDEQQKIAQYLDDKTTQIDHAISLKHQHIEKLKEYKNVLINDVVTGKVKV